MGIYGHRFDYLREGSKFFNIFKKKHPKPSQDKTKEIKESLKTNLKITKEFLNSGLDASTILTDINDFKQCMKNTGNSLSKDAEEYIKYTISNAPCATNIGISESDNISQIIKIWKDKANQYEWYEDALELLQNTNNLVPLCYDSDSSFYSQSKKKIYSMDYKFRVDSWSVDEYFD